MITTAPLESAQQELSYKPRIMIFGGDQQKVCTKCVFKEVETGVHTIPWYALAKKHAPWAHPLLISTKNHDPGLVRKLLLSTFQWYSYDHCDLST